MFHFSFHFIPSPGWYVAQKSSDERIVPSQVFIMTKFTQRGVHCKKIANGVRSNLFRDPSDGKKFEKA